MPSAFCLSAWRNLSFWKELRVQWVGCQSGMLDAGLLTVKRTSQVGEEEGMMASESLWMMVMEV